MKNKKIYNDAVSDNTYPLIFTPDYFLPFRGKQHKDIYDEEEIITWHNGYKHHKAKKEQIKKDLMPNA